MAQTLATTVERIAAFAARVESRDLADEAADRLKRILLDTLGCAIGALGAQPVRAVRSVVDALGGAPTCTLIGGGRSAPDRAALHNGCLVRYLDFLDSYNRQGEVCHPADNTAAILAAAEAVDADGRDFVTALAVAYQVHCRLLDLPTMRAGVNYTTPLAFSVAAGASRLLGMDAEQAANAMALAGVGAVSLAVIQAEPVSQWKGLASGEAASRALHNTYLARAGITGDLGVFDGPLGLFQLVGGTLDVDWGTERLDAPLRTSIKRHNAEFQAQTAVDLAIRLRAEHRFDPRAIRHIGVAVAQGAYDVLGGGTYGPKHECRTKEQADHNLLYLVAVALLDGEVWPPQFAAERINREDVQGLLRKVEVRPDANFTQRIPEQLSARLSITLVDGTIVTGEDHDYDGYFTRPMSWEQVKGKFDRLTAENLPDAGLRQAIVSAVEDLGTIRVRELAALLEQAGR